MRLAKPHKYRAKPCVIDGIRFASQAEGARYQELKLLLRAGKIHSVIVQAIFPIKINDIEVGKYIADFTYFEAGSDRRIVEDVKGVITPLFRFKQKCVEAQYGIQINIVKMKGASHGRRRSTKR